MRKILIFINGDLGISVLEYLLHREDTSIVALVLNGSEKRSSDFRERVNKTLDNYDKDIKIFEFTQDLWSKSEFLEKVKDGTFGVSALFGHIFPPKIISLFNHQLINLHPSLLPIGRGADPIFWAKVNALPQGATIHEIDAGLDTGKILVQKELKTDFWDTCGDIYENVVGLLTSMFMEFYPNWSEKSPRLEQIGESTFHRSSELRDIRKGLIDNPEALLVHLNLIQALSFNDRRKPLIKSPDNRIWEVTVNFQEVKRKD